MNLQPGDIKLMGQILDDLDDQIRECGPCEHPVNVCVCHFQRTRDLASDLFHRLSNGAIGTAILPDPGDPIDMIDFAHKALLAANLQRIAQIKAEAEAANAAFRKGNIND
jgi:hypothetical protein